ncbi:MAG: hypothetical protein ACK41C_08100 [Phenylobacterium sp.]|uniref:hypothetical protein n=1 Tax=Phenylobacterium sp. TaxID=1871053 RepID=UPI0039192D14
MSAKPAPPDRTAYLVLGMHRSGTSAATQLLALLGAELPANVMPGDEHNAKGYFEPWKIAMFNNERLRAGGGAWDDVFAFPYRPLAAEEEDRWIEAAVGVFESEFPKARFPLMKDPRVTVLLPLWRAALTRRGVTARCVIPVRHPLAVAGSLAKRDGFPVAKSVLLWTAYMLAAEAYTRDLPRVFVGYDALLADWRREVARIEAAHHASLPAMSDRRAREVDRFLTPDLRHNPGEGDLAAVPEVGALAAAVYDWCAAAARDEGPAADALDRAAREIAALRDRVGVFVSPVTRDLDAARTELLDLRQRHEHLEAQVEELNRVLDALLN